MSSLEVSRPMMIVIVLMLIVSLPLGALYIHDRMSGTSEVTREASNGTITSGFQELGLSAKVVSDITDIQGKSVSWKEGNLTFTLTIYPDGSTRKTILDKSTGAIRVEVVEVPMVQSFSNTASGGEDWKDDVTSKEPGAGGLAAKQPDVNAAGLTGKDKQKDASAATTTVSNLPSGTATAAAASNPSSTITRVGSITTTLTILPDGSIRKTTMNNATGEFTSEMVQQPNGQIDDANTVFKPDMKQDAKAAPAGSTNKPKKAPAVVATKPLPAADKPAAKTSVADDTAQKDAVSAAPAGSSAGSKAGSSVGSQSSGGGGAPAPRTITVPDGTTITTSYSGKGGSIITTTVKHPNGKVDETTIDTAKRTSSRTTPNGGRGGDGKDVGGSKGGRRRRAVRRASMKK